MEIRALSARTESGRTALQPAQMFVIGILALLPSAGLFGPAAKAVPLLPPGTEKTIVAPPDTKVAPPDTKVASPDTKVAPPDTKVAPPDTKVAPLDTKVAPLDTKVAPLDTKVAPLDTKAGPPGHRAKAASLDRADITTYKSAFDSARKRNWSAAHRHAARGRHPLPRKILRWLEMTISGGGYGFSDIVDFVNQNPDWPLPNTLRNRAEEAITEVTPSQTVLARFANRPPRTTDGKIAYGQALIAAGRVDEGYKHLRDAWIYGRFSRRDEVLFMRQYRKRFTEADHWKRLDTLLWNGHRREARRMLRRVSSGHRALATARIQLRRRRGGVDGAVSRVPASLRRDPGFFV